MHPLKCVVIGDDGVGKTSLLISYTNNEFPNWFASEVFVDFAKIVDVEKKSYELRLFDTPGSCDYDRIRPLYYQETDVFMICFSVVDSTSLESVKSKWLPTIKEKCPKAPFLLVGTKIELRDDEETIQKVKSKGKTMITKEEGEKFASEIGALKYLECSAMTRTGLKEIFEEAIRMTIKIDTKKKKKKKKCSIM